MASFTGYGMPRVDFQSLANLPDIYRRSQQQATLAELGQLLQSGQITPERAAGVAIGAGQTGLGTTLLAQEEGKRRFAMEQQRAAEAAARAERGLGIQEQELELRRKAMEQKSPEAVMAERRKAVEDAGVDPTDPRYRDFIISGTMPRQPDLTSTDKIAIQKAENETADLETTVEALNRAKELNPQTLTGMGASTRAYIGGNIVPDFPGFDKTKANATLEWEKIMAPEALQAMAATLKGATTDFELRKYIDLLAEPATPIKIRESVINRLIKLSERKKQINETRMREIRGGTYYRPGGGQSAPTATQSPPSSQGGGNIPPPPAGFRIQQ